MKMKKATGIVLCLAMLLSLAGCGQDSSDESTSSGNSVSGSSSSEDSGQDASSGDEASAEELVTINLVHGLDQGTVFEGDETIENNRYLDWIREDLKIDVKFDWVCSSTDFDQKMGMAISSNSLPDAMNVGQTQYLAMLKYDQLQPIDEAFEQYASDQLKQYVASGGDSLMNAISKDGQMYAIPAPTLNASVNEMWIRQDWLDALNLEVPKTVDDIMTVAKAFVDNKMGGENTIGIIGPSNGGQLVAVGGNQWGLDPIFGAYQSFPEFWMKDNDGNVIYGSVQPETKEALAKLAEMYASGAIDPELFTRGDSREPVVAGQVGIFFGTWSSGYPIRDALLEGDADWQAYLLPLAADGNFYSPKGAPTSRYVCIKKGYEHPEAVIKLINYLIENEQVWGTSGVAMSTTAVYPLANAYDNADEIEYSYEWLKKFCLGEVAKEDIDLTGRKLLQGDLDAIEVIKLDPKDDFSIQYWDLENEVAENSLSRLVSIMVGARPLVEDGYIAIENIFSGQTPTMELKWANLQKIEDETFAGIIRGQKSIDEFDTFVERWYAEGGQEILDEVAEAIGE